MTTVLNKVIILLLVLITFGFSTAKGQQTAEECYKNRISVFDNRQVPDDPNVMFYIQKNTNPNTIVYAINVNEEGKIDPKDPMEVFWRRYQEDGRKKKLGWLEKTFAFDFSIKPIKSRPNFYSFSLIALKKKKLFVTQSKTGKPKVIMTISERTALLERVYLMVDDSKRIQEVSSIELFGRDLKTNKPIYEKIIKE